MTDLTNPDRYLNRELSELAFQRRVLNEAVDDRNPVLERAKFLAIVTQNMDEFFMKRVGGLKQQIDAGFTEPSVDGLTPREQWETVMETARPLLEQQSRCYHDEVRGALADAGIEILDCADLTSEERDDLRAYFRSSVLPTLTPLTFDPAHPFPFISNQSLSLAVLTRDDGDDDTTFSRVKVPGNRPRLVELDDERFVLLEDVIAANLDLLFPDTDVVDYASFRVTRNAEVRRNQEVAEDLVNQIQRVLRQRRFATVVRLEIESGAPAAIRDVLVDQLGLDDREVFSLPAPLDFRGFTALLDLDRPDRKREGWTPQSHPRIHDGIDDVFAEIRDGDVLVHHPYHSFSGTVQRFFDEAARDPDVLAIKAAIYRTARDSRVIESLIEAARNGKQVAVTVELKARFDEENNLHWVDRLEEEGIHVAYGTLGYKAHTKTSLVVREEDDGVRLYSHVGTGNYHSETAKRYEDLGLLTADPDIGYDLVTLFNFFTGHSMPQEFRSLLVAPTTMRERFHDLIDREIERADAGDPARIVAKMNRLEDPETVTHLYEASRAGVDIDLVVRDICRLRPGVDDLSENITVRSIVGRFLEHSRVFYFENGAGDIDDPAPAYFIGSADWMQRNLDNRVEAIAPVTDPALRDYLDDVLDVLFSDNRRAWELHADGTYVQQRPDGDEIDAQTALMDRARREAPDPPDSDLVADYEGPLVSSEEPRPDERADAILDDAILDAITDMVDDNRSDHETRE
ncbi:polyphosphate kinase 1 [Salarchaeum sp. JOR-1]|uniref:polyphosphate kinase 1 n=1 Tax=Salarchaeum sp. JOR-1 TaxID=2599399 RepID=UPI001198B2D9|nr:polyphosphate kinase 1 [Salarchaeum sp. JOR-1]QDX40727.1 polyphosphate kinase 1 [Salarchaeum sp. JOR-1]